MRRLYIVEVKKVTVERLKQLFYNNFFENLENNSVITVAIYVI